MRVGTARERHPAQRVVSSAKEVTEPRWSTEEGRREGGPLGFIPSGQVLAPPSTDRDHPGLCFFSLPHHPNTQLRGPATLRHCRSLSSLVPPPGLLSTNPWDLTSCFLPAPSGATLLHPLPIPLLASLSRYPHPDLSPEKQIRGAGQLALVLMHCLHARTWMGTIQRWENSIMK